MGASHHGASHGRFTSRCIAWVHHGRWLTVDHSSGGGGLASGGCDCFSLAMRATLPVSHGARASKSWWRPATTNPHDKTRLTHLKLEIYLDRPPHKMRISVFSTDFYQGAIIPICGNQSIGPTVGVGGSQGCDTLFASPFFTRSPHL